ALPHGTTMNFNTLTEDVFRALSTEHDSLALEDYLVDRMESPYEQHDDWQRAIDDDIKAWLGFSSQYFLLTITVQLGDRQFALKSVLERDSDHGIHPRLRSITQGVADYSTI
ncbi:MAG: hypothetical protein HKM24_07365, partial [Gammaproteobacteria bacterium]|nr:hypothetical protein [Gammaproteobacteria bacterium]